MATADVRAVVCGREPATGETKQAQVQRPERSSTTNGPPERTHFRKPDILQPEEISSAVTRPGWGRVTKLALVNRVLYDSWPVPARRDTRIGAGHRDLKRAARMFNGPPGSESCNGITHRNQAGGKR